MTYLKPLEQLKTAFDTADAVLVGAGAGLSTSAGLTYGGERFKKYFSDFMDKYHYRDMYTAGFYPYKTQEEHWAYWSRHIFYNRYLPIPKPVYSELLSLLDKKDYFVLTTNVDHCFQKSGFAKDRLFYTQGDYGLWQCKTPCHDRTYDNETSVRRMIEEQKDMKIPTDLVPRCPVCGGQMAMNLRSDDTFVEDDGWRAAAVRYQNFLNQHADSKLLLLELGVGMNTPGIIKYPFWRLAAKHPKTTYACLNYGEAVCPDVIKERSILIDGDIGDILNELLNH